jgi:hypothetical protein
MCVCVFVGCVGQEGFTKDLGQAIGAPQDAQDRDSYESFRKQRAGFYHTTQAANRAAAGGK